MSVFNRVAKFIEVPGERSLYKNEDILPLPPTRRTWTKVTFFWFWLSTSINISTITGSSAILSLGLTVWQAILCEVIGASVITAAIVANGHQGGQWGVPFVVGNRAAWGVRGSWFVACNRLILSFCWFGVQSWYGGQCVVTLIGSMRPSFYTMKNHFPASAQMDTKDFIGFLVFWLLSLPILAIKPERYRIPAVISSICVTTGVIALLIWALARQGGGGPLLYQTSVTLGKARLEGSALGWAMVKSITTTIGGWAGACLYSSDFSRYARRPGDQVWGQIAIIPPCLIMSTVIGLLITSCAAGIYPYETHGLLWRPYKLMQVMQTEDESSGMRAAIFFLSLVFIVSQFCVNTAGCAITGSIDLQCLLPKWVNDRRGPFIVAVVAFAIQPWQLINNAATFISVLSSYSIFLGPLTGIMITDYFFVRKQTVKLSAFYTPNETSIYWYWHGVNPRAVICWALAVFPSMPGFVSSVTKGRIAVPIGWVHTSYLAWILGYVIASTLWIIVNKVWPPPGLGQVDSEETFAAFEAEDTVKSVEDEEKVKPSTERSAAPQGALSYIRG